MEQWLTVDRFDGYEVSNLGRVRSWNNTRGRRQPNPHVLAAPPVDPGYPTVMLRRNGKTFKRFVHRLVLEAFVGPAPRGYVACHHPDPTRTNCALVNLRWAPMEENERDKIRNNTRRGRLGKLLPSDIPLIRKLLSQRIKGKDIAVKFGVSPIVVSAIKTGKAWRDL